MVMDISDWWQGIAGGAAFLLLSWIVGTYVNWKVNRRTYKELEKLNATAEQILLILRGGKNGS